MCAAVSENGVLSNVPIIGPYNMHQLQNALDMLHIDPIPGNEGSMSIMTCHNLRLFGTMSMFPQNKSHPRLQMSCPLPNSPFLSPIEELFSMWKWEVFDIMIKC